MLYHSLAHSHSVSLSPPPTPLTFVPLLPLHLCSYLIISLSPPPPLLFLSLSLFPSPFYLLISLSSPPPLTSVSFPLSLPFTFISLPLHHFCFFPSYSMSPLSSAHIRYPLCRQVTKSYHEHRVSGSIGGVRAAMQFHCLAKVLPGLQV